MRGRQGGQFSTRHYSRYQKGETSLYLNGAGDDGVLVWDGHGICWTICKQSAPRTRQITTPTPHRSIFYRLDAAPDAQPTNQSTEGNKFCRKILEGKLNYPTAPVSTQLML